MIGSETVTVIHSAGARFDPYGDPGTETPARTEIAGCLVADGSSVEQASRGRESVASDYVVYTPSGVDVDVSAGDRIEIRGQVCEVDGRSFAWCLNAWHAGTEIRASLREG